jgi:hypothetical protein
LIVMSVPLFVPAQCQSQVLLDWRSEPPACAAFTST